MGSGASTNDPAIKPLHEKLLKLLKDVDALTEDVKRLKQEKITGPEDKEITDLRARVEHLRKEQHELSSELDLLVKGKLLGKAEKHDMLIGKLESAAEEIRKEKLCGEELQREIREVESVNERLSAEIRQAETVRNGFAEENKNKNQIESSMKNENFPGKLAEVSGSLEADSEKLRICVAENQSLEGELVEVENKDTLDSDIARLKAEIIELREKVNSLTVAISGFSEQSLLEAEISRLNAAIDEANSNLSTATAEKERILHESARLRLECTDLETHIGGFTVTEEQVLELARQKKVLEGEVSGLSAQIKASKGTLHDLKKEEKELEENVEDRRKKRAKVQKKLKKFEELQGLLGNSRDEYKGFKVQLTGFKERIKAHKESLKVTVEETEEAKEEVVE
jgi:DNA repair exonuclease SbcCD ATPase subunit